MCYTRYSCQVWLLSKSSLFLELDAVFIDFRCYFCFSCPPYLPAAGRNTFSPHLLQNFVSFSSLCFILFVSPSSPSIFLRLTDVRCCPWYALGCGGSGLFSFYLHGSLFLFVVRSRRECLERLCLERRLLLSSIFISCCIAFFSWIFA